MKHEARQMIDYRKLAQKIFEPQMIVDFDDTDRVIEVCEALITEAGYPLLEDDGESEGWIEFVYEAGDMWEISKNGYVYKKVKRADKVQPNNPSGWYNQLVTRADHPAFDY